jgi:hypothetical protein
MSTKSHGITFRKTVVSVITAVGASNVTQENCKTYLLQHNEVPRLVVW